MKLKLLLVIFCLFALSIFGQEKDARKFDEFGELSCDELSVRMQYLGMELSTNKNSIALIYVYEGKHYFYDSPEKYSLPRFGESVARARTMRTRIAFLKFDPRNIIFADGGFRENYWVEVWIVPKGTSLPKATQTLETTKYRKGVPTDICREF